MYALRGSYDWSQCILLETGPVVEIILLSHKLPSYCRHWYLTCQLHILPQWQCVMIIIFKLETSRNQFLLVCEIKSLRVYQNVLLLNCTFCYPACYDNEILPASSDNESLPAAVCLNTDQIICIISGNRLFSRFNMYIVLRACCFPFSHNWIRENDEL